MNLTGDMLNRFIESQIFFPDPFLICTPAEVQLDYEDVWFVTTDGIRLHGWLVPSEENSPLMLFCHGNAGNVSHRVDNIRRLHDIGISVFIFDYRGYGQSSGRITEAGFYLDAEAAYREARKYVNRGHLKLVIFGRSLGGIAAVHLGAQHNAPGLILESTFTHMAAMAAVHFPLPVPGKLLQNRLNALEKIPRVKASILFFHGDLDTIVPIDLGRELFNAATASKEFVTIAGAGHNDTYFVGGREYFDKIRSFIESLPAEAV
ncbi:MAG: alpha/beta hydrolase [Desulfomonile tiedjei]|nr:alpha/beta hydrolase [Desulfomonile tiedjei]